MCWPSIDRLNLLLQRICGPEWELPETCFWVWIHSSHQLRASSGVLEWTYFLRKAFVFSTCFQIRRVNRCQISKPSETHIHWCQTHHNLSSGDFFSSHLLVKTKAVQWHLPHPETENSHVIHPLSCIFSETELTRLGRKLWIAFYSLRAVCSFCTALACSLW